MQDSTNNRKNHLPGLAIIFALCGYILLLGYVDILSEYAIYNEKRIIQVLLLGFICTLALVFYNQNITLIFSQLPSLSRQLLLLILILGITSTVFKSTHYEKSLLDVGLFGLLFISVLSVASIYQPLQHTFHKIVLSCLLLTASLNIIMVASGYIASLIEPIQLLPYDLILNFAHTRFFNQLQSWTLPLIVLPIIFWSQEKPYYKIIYILIATGWWWLLFVSGGRGTLLGISIALVLTFFIYKTHARQWIKWQLICAFSGFFTYYLLFYIVPTLGNISANFKTLAGFSALRNTGSSGREYIWLHSWELLKNDLLLGIGPMNFACFSAGHFPIYPAHPHNSLIQIAVEWGLPAALIVVFLFSWGIWRWTKKDNLSQINIGAENHPVISIALFASLITAAVHALFSGIIIMPHSQVMMVLVLGWMLGLYFNTRKQAVPASSFASVLLTLLTVLSLFSLLVGMYPVMTTFNLDEMAVQQLPRFWQQGLLCD